ncbi:quinone-dependent dihydroorotate dehydrogenase [Pleomorphomonas sp. NRK KF1]|uniref:quinone-dependent dihydroorotate dehydrogenase n=1 Tax=Pleomorphomonas sp. NRK KF1 TaxID=2943000 RepID=UPI0020434239|nr:quinone-dependent dihydroorotate dehydrogenase [Pleomorphomonas sp. NRK KF1]MCM5553753.1 quinone-dependent dihydroorotate dehydrogenase [Pleomorphomonas sp. NRK KF1]
MNLSELIGSFSAAALRRFDPEMAHTLAVTAMRFNLAPGLPKVVDERLAVSFFDMRLDHPIGLAAGFDKDAEIADVLLKQGFSHVEVGTLTPRPQPGNPKPRIFRLPEANAVINRCGFNGKGHAHALKQLVRRGGRPGVVGINVGANKDSSDRAADYVTGIKAFAGLASYFTVNISSPNTPGLRDLQASAALSDLVARIIEARDETTAAVGRQTPVLVKIAPDLDEAALDDIAAVVAARGADGLVISNTTLSRSGVFGPTATEPGGLSGKPLFERSTIVLAKMRERVGRTLPIIGVGGVMTGEDAYLKIAAGANLVQVYTAFIYGGGNAINAITTDLLNRIERSGIGSARALAGSDTRAWASRPIPI